MSNRIIITVFEDWTGIAPKEWRWLACFGEYDLNSVTGVGRTKEEAVRDLVNNYDFPEVSGTPKESAI